MNYVSLYYLRLEIEVGEHGEEESQQGQDTPDIGQYSLDKHLGGVQTRNVSCDILLRKYSIVKTNLT